MNRLTMAGFAVVLVGTMLTGGTLVSVALAATGSEDVKRMAEAAAKSVTDADASPIHAVAAEAAATTLGTSAEELASLLADGASLKLIADGREVGYGTLARAVNGAVATALGAAVESGSLSERRADEIGSVVADWIDHGGQPDEGWFGATD